MNELWMIGVVGGGAGAAVGAPLLFRPPSGPVRWSVERLTGFWLVGAAVAMVLIAVRHGGFLSPGPDVVVEHVTNAMNLVSWTILVDLARRMTGVGPLFPAKPERHLALPIGYAAVILSLGGADIRFLWLMPVGVTATTAIAVTWFRTRATVQPAVARQAGAVVAASVVYCTAQGIRSLFPHVVELREVVPLVMTVAPFVIAFALSRRQTGSRQANDGAAMLDGRSHPRYVKSSLTSREADRLISHLDARMESACWYREPDLSLASLASRLDVSPHTLSQALNQGRGESLTRYLTCRRIAEARRLLAAPASDCFTIEGIAQQAGFASRSAFYRAFREAEGLTPTAYRDRVRRQASVGEAVEVRDHSR